MDLKVLVSSADHVQYAENVCLLIAESAKARGTGIVNLSIFAPKWKRVML